MKKKLMLMVLMIIIFITGCTKKEKGLYYDLNKLNKYLYEITYNDYKYDTNLETITNVEDFGCSSVKNGNYYGRNFDFIYNDVPEFIVRVNANKNRHASIGVTNVSSIKSYDNLTENQPKILELLPNFTLDGINDNGVICSINVVPKEDVIPVTGTNPNGENLHMGLIVRYVLDNADSADNAIELLKGRNIYGDLGEHYNLHIMIADKDKTYVVEFIDNKLVAQEKKDNEQIMTNFYVNLNYLTENSAGVERYNILKENYDEGNTFEGMWKLLQRVKYSQAYLFDNTWYSEFLTQSQLSSMGPEGIKTNVEFNELKQNYWISRTYNYRNPSNSSYWFTTHNSTYDINKIKLRVTIQEDYNNYYEYTLD